MNRSLTRSIGFWLLLALSLASVAIGGWLVAGQLGSMTTTLLANTATGVDVYVGQSLVVVGSVLLGAGVIGILLAVALSAVQAVLPKPAPAVIPVAAAPVAAQPIDEAAAVETPVATEVSPVAEDGTPADSSEDEVADHAEERQNGSSGSIATATKISVK